MANIKQTVKLGVFTLAIMNVTAVVSLRGLPAEAVYGMSSAFYYLFAAIVFLIPTSLVAAELAAMFQDKQGGVFRWVGEAYGKRLGFLAILTGKAGTGKTTFLRQLKSGSPKRMVVLAPTGIAAINAGGVTIHSFFQLPFAPYVPDTSFSADGKAQYRFRFGKELET